MLNNHEFFEKMELPNDKINKYKCITFSEENSIKIEKITNNYKVKEKFNLKILENIWTEYGILEEDISIVLILYLLEIHGWEFWEIFNREFTSDSYYDREFKENVLRAMKYKKNFKLSLEETKKYCLKIYNYEHGNLNLYFIFSNVISEEFLQYLTNDFLLNPIKEMNYLLIYALKSRKLLKEFIETYQAKTYEEMLFIVLSCSEITQTDNEFAYTITKRILLTKIDREWDRLELINHYLPLLFALLMRNEDKSLAEEIESISNNFKEWQLNSIVYPIYRDRVNINNSVASSLYYVLNKASADCIKNLEYPISAIYSTIDDENFFKYMLPILSLTGIDKSQEILTRIKSSLDFSLEIIVKESFEVKKNYQIAIKVLKSLYLEGKVSVVDFNEDNYIKLLRMFHYFELDGNFICDIAVNLLLNASSKDIQNELFDYIISSVYDNYFYILFEKELNMTDTKLDKLKSELITRKAIRDKAISNPDFKPSEKNMNMYLEKQAEMNRKIYKKAEEYSIFANLFSKKIILYGHKVQYNHFSEDGDLITDISEMHEMSQSMPIPIRYINDPMFRHYELSLILKERLND